MNNIPNKTLLAIIPVNDPSPVAYMNVFEPGDIWIKTKGCEGCKDKDRCCNQCKLLSDKGCSFQTMQYSLNKPFRCIVKPEPNQGRSYCQLEFLCIKGKYKNKIRKLNDPLSFLDS